ncbi:unnamed protein product, partial [Rotaria magnacalcarata]
YSRDSTQSDISNRDPPTTKNKQPCVYVSGVCFVSLLCH